jgi:hypothetical protein
MNGLYCRANIWRMNNSDPDGDDVVGGAMISGTLVYESVQCAFQDSRATQALYEQGLEVPRLVDCVMIPETMDIRERDEVEVVSPYNHRFVNKRLRIIEVIRGITHPSSRHGHIELRLQRVERTRTQQ